MGLILQDKVVKIPWIGGQSVIESVVSRNELNSMLIKQNKLNSKIVYEFDTKVLNIDFKDNIIETQKKNQQKIVRKFSIVLGTDGYNSQVREGIDK